MPSPTASSSTSSVGQSSSLSINALLGGSKWGGAIGTAATLSYSFPWANSTAANYAGHNGVGNYSSLNEQNATSHYSLNATQQTAARGALESWASVANISFNEVADTNTNVGDIRFAWTSATDTTSTGGKAWGWAYFPSSYWPSGGDIWISTLLTGTAASNWSVGSYNYQALIHEVGHALGLKHSFEGSPVLPASQDSRLYTVMSYTTPPKDIYPVWGNVGGSFGWVTYRISPETPMVLDIAAIQYLYGANTGYRTGNDVYAFDLAKPFFKTIWDAGGRDTISAGNFTLACDIDLTPGSYSSLRYPAPSNTGGATTTYDGSNNLGIAFGCIIENAIGGSGNDRITGNSADNTLDGGAGSDTVLFKGLYSAARISYDSGTKAYQVFTLLGGTDTLYSVEYFQFDDKLVAATSAAITDTTAPTISSFSPADAATGIALASNIVLTFSEAIQRGTGSIVLRTAGGTTVATYDAATSSNLTISGSTLTIDPSSDLANNTNYHVVFAAGSVKDLAGNSYAGTTSYDFTTLAAASPSSATSLGTSTGTKAKVFMGVNDTFTVNDSGASLIGNLGSNIVKIAAGVTGVKADANFSRVEFSGSLTDYKFGVVPGTGLQVLNAAGVAVYTVVSLNSDTTLAFANGSASLVQTGITSFTFGGQAIATTTAATMSIALNSADASTFGTTTSRATTKAKIFMGVDDSLTVSDNGATLVGNLGSNTVKIAAGVTGLKTDANFTRIELGGNLADYKLGVIPGLGLQLQNVVGVAVDTIVSLNTDLTLAFGDGSATLKQSGISDFTLGGMAISTTQAGYLPVTLDAADKSFVATVAESAIPVSAVGDDDEIIEVAATSARESAIVQLSGIATDLDASIFSMASFNPVFGAGLFA